LFEVRNIDKHFGAVTALKGASLKVAPGEVRALLGSNGSGKSTMIKVLSGLVYPNSGEISIDGKRVEINSGHDALKLGIATAFQDLSSVPAMTVMDNIVLGREKSRRFGIINRRETMEEVLALLDRFDLECDPGDFVQALVPSTQSMLEVAKAVYAKPRLLLLDEVTASMRRDRIEALFRIIKELKSEGVAILYVTHRMNEIYEVCDSVTIMRNGEVSYDGVIKDLSLDEIVFHMTGRRPDTKHTGIVGGIGENEPTAIDGDSETDDALLRIESLKIEPRVKDISMTARRGRIVGISGLEGQGQPEFIRAVLGAIKPESGRMFFRGREAKFQSAADAVNENIGFISGERGNEAIYPNRTVAENICAALFAKGPLFLPLWPKTVNGHANAAVGDYKIVVGSIRHPASSLSGGNQQKLVAARWLSMKPDLLLLDDPTKGVDVHSRAEIHSLLRAAAGDGMTVIISSSENEELLELADCIYVFYEGIVAAVLQGDAKTAERLVAAMMGMTESRGGDGFSGERGAETQCSHQ